MDLNMYTQERLVQTCFSEHFQNLPEVVKSDMIAIMSGRFVDVY